MDNLFYTPPELLSENTANKDYAKPLTNDDVYNIIHSLTDRIDDIYYIIFALEGFNIEDRPRLLPIDRLNNSNTLSYLDLINRLCGLMQQKVKNIQDNLNEVAENN
jgi:hypothetical protein